MNRVRYAVVGVNGIGDLHVRFAARNPRVELAALVDVDEETVRRRAEEVGAAWFTDFDEMLREAGVEAASLCVPNHLHAPMIDRCLDAGVHPFVEKPLALTFADGARLVEKARARGLLICVGHQYRLHRTARTMKKILDDGEIGRVTRLLWSWHAFRNHRYFSAAPWRGAWRSAGGGALVHTASHEIDLIVHLAGPVARVSALLTDQLHGAGLDDSICANLLFESGAAGTLQVSINENDRYSVRQLSGEKGVMAIGDCRSHSFDHKDDIRVGRYEEPLRRAVESDRGMLHQPRVRWRRAALVGDQPAWMKQLQRTGLWKPRPHGLEVLMGSFVRSIREGGEPLVTGASALHTVELMNAMVLSAMRRRDVDLPLDPAATEGLFDDLDGRLGSVLAWSRGGSDG